MSDALEEHDGKVRIGGRNITNLRYAYGENLIARCSQVHGNFTMGVNRKILINLIYLFIHETYFMCALVIYYLPIIDMYFLNFLFKRKLVCF